MRTSRVFSVFLAALLIAGLLSSCKKAPAPTRARERPVASGPTAVSTPTAIPTVAREDSTPRADTVAVLVADPIYSLEPYEMVRVHPEGSIASHLWDTLTCLDDDLEIEPCVAISWRVIGDLTWEFTLRPDVHFHNGEPLDADAVRFSIDRARSMPGSTETFANDVELWEVQVVSEHVIRLTTLHPVPDLPYHLAFLEIVPPGYYSATDLPQLANAPVGSGPYQVEAWTPGQALTLRAVTSYWKGEPRWQHVVFRVVPNLWERLQALRDGGADLVTDLAPIGADKWDVAGTRLETIESTTRMLVGMRVAPGTPLAERRVRQALNYGVDVNRVVEERLAGYGERYGSWVNPPASNVGLTPWPYDPDLARQLLAEAGYPDGLSVAMSTPDGAYYQDVAIAQSLAEQWGQIGVRVQVEPVDWSTYVEQLLSDDPPPLFLLAVNSRGNPLQDLRNLSHDWPYNPTGWQNPLFEQRLQLAMRTFDAQARAKSLDQLQALAYDEAPCIWLWRQYYFYGVSQRLDWAPRRDGLVCLYQSRSN